MDANDKPIAADITERKAAETQYRTIIQTALDGFWVNDAVGRILDVNDAYCKLIGYSREELLRMTVSDVEAVEKSEDVATHLEKVIRTGSDRFETRHRCKDGRLVSLEVSSNYTKDNGRFFVFLRDITERKHAEMALKSAHTQLEALWSISSLADADAKAICDHVLSTITRMTGSPYGFYGFINDDESVMTIHAWSGEAMKNCSMVNKPQQFPIREAGLWAEAVRRREPLILNDYGIAHPAKKGLPEGHVKLTSLIVVPFFSRGQITAVVAVANKPGGYTKDDIALISSFLVSIQAISESKRSEEILRENESRLDTIFEHSPIAIWEEDFTAVKTRLDALKSSDAKDVAAYLRGHPEELIRCAAAVKVLRINETSLRLFGAKSRDEIPAQLPLYFTAASLDVFADELAALASGQRHWEGEIPIRMLKGEARIFYISLSVTPNHEDTWDSVVVSFMDITDRRRAEDELKASEKKFRLLADFTNDWEYWHDNEGRFLYVSPAVERITGYKPEEFIADPALLDRIILAEDMVPLRERIAKALSTDAPLEMEFRIRHRDGREVWISHACIVIFGPDNKPLGRRATNRDITDRKRAEEATRESEARFRSLVERAPEAIFVQSEGRFTYLNPTMVKLIGVAKQEDLLGREFMERIAPEFREVVRERIKLQRETGKPAPPMEQEYLRLDGSRVSVETTAMPIRYEGRDAHMVFVRDITERKELEEELRQAQKMEAIGQLAGGIAHDFNNQLNVLLGYGEMILNKTKDATLRKYATQIVGASNRSADLVKQLLAFSRKGQYTVKLVDLHAVLAETLTVLKRTVNKKITLKQTFKAADAMVMGDQSLLQNAFLNLSLNARDAMPEGGELGFATEIVTLDPADIERLGGGMEPGPFVKVTVRDAGHGMTEEVQKHLFEPFFTTKGIGKGTGLGLAAVYGTVKRHGGGIEVESKVGRGTTFTIYLPAAARDAMARPEDAVLRRPARVKVDARILVVDDEEAIATLAADSLKELGYEVVCKEDGAAAVEYYRRNWRKIDVVILDLNMPNMSGAETFAAMRKVDPDAKIVIASGYSEEGGAQELLKQGAVDFLAKPFRPDEMALKIEEVLRPNGKAGKVT